jgi:hypothetical protein
MSAIRRSALEQLTETSARVPAIAVSQLKLRDIKQRLVAFLIQLEPPLCRLQRVVVEAVAVGYARRLPSYLHIRAQPCSFRVFLRRGFVLVSLQFDFCLQQVRGGLLRVVTGGRCRLRRERQRCQNGNQKRHSVHA